MIPNRICDLLMHWILNQPDIDKEATRAKLELPPPGYTGSLRGTAWDPDAILDGYRQ